MPPLRERIIAACSSIYLSFSGIWGWRVSAENDAAVRKRAPPQTMRPARNCSPAPASFEPRPSVFGSRAALSLRRRLSLHAAADHRADASERRAKEKQGGGFRHGIEDSEIDSRLVHVAVRKEEVDDVVARRNTG